MKIFPYNVIYRVSNLNVQIIAVFHQNIPSKGLTDYYVTF